MKSIRSLLFGLVFIATASVGFSQDLGEQLRKLSQQNAQSYVAPLMNGWGAGLNSGLFYTADVHGILGFDLHIRLTGAVLDDADKKFMFQTPPTIGPLTRGVDYPAQVEANTVVGDNAETSIRQIGTGAELMKVPGGFSIPTAPLIVPQVSIGLPFGFEVMGRFFPTAKIGDVGKVNMLGFGLRHDIDQYIPLLPIDVAVHFMTQKLNFEDANGNKLVEASGTAYGIEVSKHIILFTVYAGFQLESSTLKIGPFTSTVGGNPVPVAQFSIDGKNKSRVLAGVRVSLLFLNIHADYSVASTSVLTLGAGITFR